MRAVQTAPVDSSPSEVGIQQLPSAVYGGRVLCLARPKLDQQSTSLITEFTSYSLKGNAMQLGIFEVLMHGKGKKHLGFREEIGCAKGELVIAAMRDVENWITIDGKDYGMIEWANVMGKLRELPRTLDIAALTGGCEQCAPDALVSGAYCPAHEVIVNLERKRARFTIEPVQNYCLIERDDAAMHRYLLPPNLRERGTVLEDLILSDGYRSDNEQRNRFPILYARLRRKGPGKRYPIWNEALGCTEIVDEQCDADEGSVVAFISTMAHCRFRFNGRDFSLVHARNVLMEMEPPECGATS